MLDRFDLLPELRQPDDPSGCPPSGGKGRYGSKCQTCAFGPNGSDSCGGCNANCMARHGEGCGSNCQDCIWNCTNRQIANKKSSLVEPAHVKLRPWALDPAEVPLLSFAVEGDVEQRPWPLYWVKYQSLVTRHGFRAEKRDFRGIYNMPADCRTGLSFTSKDDKLEELWPRFRDLLQQLPAYRFNFSLSVNFSSWADAPRMETITNRLRSIESVGLLQTTGVNVIPHTEGVTTLDFERMAEWVEANKPPAICMNMQNHKRSDRWWRASIAELSGMLARLSYSPTIFIMGVAAPRRAASLLIHWAGREVRFINSNCFNAAKYYYEYVGQQKVRRHDISRVEIFELNVRHWYDEIREWHRIFVGGDLPDSVLRRYAIDTEILRQWATMPSKGGPDPKTGRRSNVRANLD